MTICDICGRRETEVEVVQSALISTFAGYDPVNLREKTTVKRVDFCRLCYERFDRLRREAEAKAYDQMIQDEIRTREIYRKTAKEDEQCTKAR